MQDINEERVLLMLKKSPSEGIDMAIDKYGGPVKTICKNILFDCSGEDIEEAVADSFVGLWKSIDKFKSNGNYSLKSYLYGIARHTALDKRRVMKKETFVLSVEEVVIEATVDLECDYVKKLNENIVHDSVNSMEEPMRSVFILRYFYYEKVNDIAKRLGLTPKVVENHLYRGKSKLKRELLGRGVQYE
ncbi:RNA polymerase sigma-70 factor, ECF subfamily [Anaerovirgula multivorans]|uniref:RNA polymerase sigma-70 factor, ECF subfamily n=1 Tax=Anaerovirgula multivorans TaxID=312168 RepID=A0A239F7E1_9FIRM|nr:sigma-70 family RNA polymerase sigma factor [Anaerovirgula multivorans]SNS52816.1 RNA polymerase sigma-70 factor, ECF subfamily [Anaerovirgula multivorans]